MYQIQCALVLLLSVFVVRGAEFGDCGSELGKFTLISVTGCGESDASCILHKGTNATIQIQFTTEENISQVKSVVHGVLNNIPIPFPLHQPNACTDSESGLSCPLAKGASYSYKATLPIEKQYPKLAVTVKWELKNEAGKDIVCVLIPAKIQQ